MSSNTREQTFLRVKRRRDEYPPSTIRLELLGGWNLPVQRSEVNEDENVNSVAALYGAPSGETSNTSRSSQGFSLRSLSTTTLADSRHSNLSTTSTVQTQGISNRRRTTTPAAVWKRVEDLEGDAIMSANSNSIGGFGGNKRCRVVDAILEGDGPTSKRRKLTVLGEVKPEDTKTKPKKKKSNVYRVLDPVTRLVDDSLDMVHAGDRPVAEHYTFVTTDPRLANNSRSWLMHQNRGGTLLHACAHWNDVETSHAVLQQSLLGMADAVDEDGRTPYEVAQLCCHESMVEMLEAFGADTTNFVYDMFVPEEIPLVDATTHSVMREEWDPLNKSTLESATVMSGDNKAIKYSSMQQQPLDMAILDTSRLLELQGGVGYWTEDGDLILEVEPHHMMGAAEFGHDSEEEYNEDDIDSNCEDYGGNDYPEDESWDEEFLHEAPAHDDDSYEC
jgi:Transcription factor Iwr1